MNERGAASAARAEHPPPRAEPDPRLLAGCLQKIRHPSEVRVSMDRATLACILDNQPALVSSVPVVPVRVDGGGERLQVISLGRDQGLSAIGLKRGDLLLDLDGHDLTDPSASLAAYERARRVDTMRLHLVRGGQPIEIMYEIR